MDQRFDGTQYDQYGAPIWDSIPVWRLAERIVLQERDRIMQQLREVLDSND